jgi:hypothetical protein
VVVPVDATFAVVAGGALAWELLEHAASRPASTAVTKGRRIGSP